MKQSQWSFDDFARWAFYGLISLLAVNFNSNFGKVQDSISTLNTQIAVVVQKVQVHDEKLSEKDERDREQDQRLRELEIKRRLK